MVFYIKGTISYLLDDCVVIDNNGFGWQIMLSDATLNKLPPVGENIILFLHTIINDDNFSLYGFLTLEEKKLFNILLGVSGVGPKSALKILSALTPAQLTIAILSEDFITISKSGLNRKIAQRISLELKDKIKMFDPTASVAASSQQSLDNATKERQDATEALISLGYSRAETIKAVMEVAKNNMQAEIIIRLALKKLSAKV